MPATLERRKVAFDLYGIQEDFVLDDNRFVAFIGGRGSGKTYSGSVKAVLRAMRGGLGVIAAPDFPMLEHGAKRQFLDRLQEIGVDYTLNGQKGVLTIPAWNAEILFATLETESRVRGPNFEWGWVDELDYLAQHAVWKALKGAIRAGNHPQLWATSTPKGRVGVIYGEWVLGDDERHALYRATTFDNLFIDAADYVAGLGYAGAFYEQEIEAQFVAFEGLVYPGFNRERNVRANVDCSGWGTTLAMDVGTRNPTAILTMRHSGDRLHIERELYRRGMSSDDMTAAAVAAWETHRPEFLVIDPSAAALIETLTRRHLRVRKAINDVMVGIALVSSTIPNLTVDPSCVNLIAEFESYQYPDAKRGAGEKDAPVKANDHALDALRYGVQELFGRVPAPVMAPARVTQTSTWSTA